MLSFKVLAFKTTESLKFSQLFYRHSLIGLYHFDLLLVKTAAYLSVCFYHYDGLVYSSPPGLPPASWWPHYYSAVCAVFRCFLTIPCNCPHLHTHYMHSTYQNTRIQSVVGVNTCNSCVGKLICSKPRLVFHF